MLQPNTPTTSQPLAVLTADQLSQIVTDAARLAAQTALGLQQASTADNAAARRYVYGIRGIRDLFNVSHVTACKYKATWLAPAVTQRGRTIIVDADKALRLFAGRNA